MLTTISPSDEAFDRWNNEKRPAVVSRLKARGVRDAEDVVQQALIGLAKCLGPGISPIEPLFNRILSCRFNDSLRRQYKAGRTIPLEDSGAAEIADDRDNRANEWREFLGSVLEHIRTDTFEPLFDFHVREVSLADLATKHKVTKDVLKERLSRLRAKARMVFASIELSCFDDICAL